MKSGPSPSESLQVTKLRQVSPQGLIDRSHLCDWLNGGRQPQLTLVAAPAGYGKSSLLHAVCARMAGSGLSVGWLSLDSDDNDPVRLLTYLAAAIDDAVPGIGRRALDLLRAGQQPADILAVRTLLADVAAAELEVTLFLDDGHLLAAPGAEGILRRLIMEAPANLRFVIASRGELPLDRSRHRLSQDLWEIDAAGLALNPGEIRDLVAGCHLPPIDDRLLQALHRTTEGWAAGIQLYLLAVGHDEDQQTLLDQFGGRDRHLSDYLAQTVLRALKPDLRDFVLQTAALDRFCAEACGALLPDTACKAMIEELDRSNLFVIPLDRHRKWYRYHYLFGEFLRDRLETEQPGRLAANQRKAARWCAENGAFGEAIDYAKRSGDFAFAADLIARVCGHAGQYQGDHGTVLHWIQGLPDSCLDRLPQIRLSKAWSLCFTNGHEEALGEVARVERISSSAQPQTAAALRQEAGVIRCVSLCLTGDADAARALGVAWLRDWPDAADFPRGAVGIAMAYACIARREYTVGLSTAEGALSVHTRCHSDYGTICALAVKGLLLEAVGRLGEAEQVVMSGLQQARRLWGKHSQASSQMSALLAGILYGCDRLDDARRHFADGAMAMEQIASPELKFIQYGIGARLARDEDPDRALALIRSGIAEARVMRQPALAARLAAEGVALLLSEGRVTQAENLAWRDFPERPDPEIEGEEPDWAAAQRIEARRDIAIRHALWHGHHRTALAEAKRQAVALDRSGTPAPLITALLQKAVALDGSGAGRPALRAMDEAVRLATETGLVRRIIDDAHWAGGLLQRYAGSRPLLSADDESGPAVRIRAFLERFAQANEADELPARSTSAGHDPEADLRPKEIQILAHVAQGLSNRDIAETLFVSEKTVKWHLYNAYAKLGVKNRTAAVRKARAAALLD